MESQEQLSAEQWHWATEFSPAQSGSEDELLVQLAAGELPPYVLVWQPGWGQWLPAMHVARLSPVLPVAVVGAAQVAMSQPLDEPRPTVPVFEFPRLRLLARDRMRAGTSRIQSLASLQSEAEGPSWARRMGNAPEQEVITVQLTAAQLAQAVSAMQQPEPPERMPWEPPGAAREQGDAVAVEANWAVQPEGQPQRDPSEEPPPASGKVQVSDSLSPGQSVATETAWWGEARATAARRAALASDSDDDQGLSVRRVLAVSVLVAIVVAVGAYFFWRSGYSAVGIGLGEPPIASGLVGFG